MPIVGQLGGWLTLPNFDGTSTFSTTVEINGRDAFAEIALIHHYQDDEFGISRCGITQIVSDAGRKVEDFDINYLPEHNSVNFRRNMTQITFSVLSSSTWTGARWMLHFWS